MMENNLFVSTSQEAKEVYEAILDNLKSFGAYTVEFKKTSIHIVNRVAFLGIHPKRKWLDINIVSDHPLESPLIRKTEQVSAHRFHNTIRLEDKSEVTNEVKDFFKEAYQLMA